jgi:hypothetical protein
MNEKEEDVELESCPFCGSIRLTVDTCNREVACNRCRSSGPTDFGDGLTIRQIVAAWNDRAGLHSIEARDFVYLGT